MEPEDWGPTFWDAGHAVSFYYPDDPTDDEKLAAKNYYYALAYLLPCDTCCEDYGSLLHKNPIDEHLDTMEELSLWFYNIHSAVNRKLGKRNQPSYEQVKRKFLKLEPKYRVSEIAQKHHSINTIQNDIQERQKQLERARDEVSGRSVQARYGSIQRQGARGNDLSGRSVVRRTQVPTRRASYLETGGSNRRGSGTGSGGCKDCGKGRRRTRYG